MIAAHELTTNDESPVWSPLDDVLAKRPALFAAVATALMLLVAVPFFSMRLGAPDASSDLAFDDHTQGVRLASRGFGPGYNGPS